MISCAVLLAVLDWTALTASMIIARENERAIHFSANWQSSGFMGSHVIAAFPGSGQYQNKSVRGLVLMGTNTADVHERL